jgi:tetratricopeptide (TPR) repeat protein
VAVLFTDMVGSTELSQGLPQDAADEVRRGHFSILRQAIAETGGTQVKNLGDGLMVVFGSASAALACGVAMQQGVDKDNRRHEHSVGLRVGVSTGEVSRDDDDYFGDPVVEASRLCDLCESGQILATELARLTAGRRNRHECRSLGELVLKGLPDPVETVEVLWTPLRGVDAGAVVPLPARLAVRPTLAVVGRSAELELLAASVKRVTEGEGREVLLISGEAGVGKTTLVADVAQSAFDEGTCVLFGHCEEDLTTPYQLFAEALGHYVTYAPEDQLLAHVDAHGSEIARLVPALASRVPGLPPTTPTDADTERYLLFGAVVDLLASASQHQPIILAFDDLQWADKGSLLLLRHVVSTDLPMRLIVLGTYRDSELSYSHTLVDTLGALHRLSGVIRIELAGLDDTGVVSVMEAAAGHSLDEAGVRLAHAIYRETDGNPFFVIEVLRHLTETGAIYRDPSGRWVAIASLEESALPDSVRMVIGGRVGRLGHAAQQVLSLAAVIGQDFDLDVLARASGESEDDVLDALDRATASALVREQVDAPGRFRFAHGLIQRTLYEDLGPTRRARAHRRVGEALEALYRDQPGARVGELAHHWFSATQPIDVTKAIAYSREAADAALAALAPDDAVHYYSQALQLLGQERVPDPSLEIDLLIGLGTAQRQAGMAAFRETLLDAAGRAQAQGATDRLVVAALANNRGLFSSLGVVDVEKVEVLRAALDAMPADDSNDRALLLATLCNELTHGTPLEERQALADDAKAMARRLADPATVVSVLNLVEQPLECPPTLEERLADAVEALSLAEALDDPVPLYFAAVYRRISAMQAGDFGQSSRCLDQMQALSARLRQPILTWITTFHRAAEALLFGDHELGERLTTEALEIATDSGQPDAVTFYGSQLLIVRHEQGRLGEILPIISAVAAEMTAMPEYLGAVAAAQVEAGEHDQARALVRAASADGFASVPMDIGWLHGLVAYAQAAIDLKETVAAAQLYDLLAPYHGQVSYNGLMPLEPVAMYLGALASLVGRYEEAEAHFREAAELNERAGATFAAARNDFSWGRMLLARGAAGDADRARDLLARAHATAAARGFGYVEAHAAEALQTLG